MNDPQNSVPTLTPRQRDVLEFIRQHFRKFGYSPTVRELAKGMEIHSPNGVVGHLEALQRKGFILRLPHLSRSIILTEAATPQKNGLPVAALLENGQLVENPVPNERMDVHEKTRVNRRDFSWIRVQSDWKLNDLQLKKGDFLLIRQSQNPSVGEMGLVRDSESKLLLTSYPFDETVFTLYGILVAVMRFEF